MAHCVLIHLKRQPLFQRTHHIPVPGSKEKGQEEGPCPRNPTEIKPMPLNCHACYYSQSLLARDSPQTLLYSHRSTLHPHRAISSGYECWRQSVLCSLIAHVELGLTFLCWFDWPPVALPLCFHVVPKLISTCTPSTRLQSCWPDGQACVSGQACTQVQLTHGCRFLESAVNLCCGHDCIA